MAQGGTPGPPGGGTNNLNRRSKGGISYPVPNPPTMRSPFDRGAGRRIGMDANHPIIEHTQRPGPMR